MKTTGSLFPRSVLAVAVAIVAAAPVMAQNTTAAIGGRVATPDGKPVAGATVVVLHRESGSVNTLTTDADGRYTARGLRVGGPYIVTVSKGSDKSVNDEVYLALAETTLVDLRLGSAQVQLEQVVITGSAATKFNASNMGAGTQIGRQELDAYASIQRNLQDYARSDPRLSQTDKERGEISAAGQNTRYNSITIDGVSINDTFGLESNNLPTIKQPISIDAIQSVQVNISNYDVTQKGYTGANINAVTKSGTNDLKGSLYYVFRDDKMVGDRLRNNLSSRTTDEFVRPAPFTEDTKGIILGGPIIKDKLFFFANYEELKSSRNAPNFGPIGSDRTNVAISQSAIDQAIALSSSAWRMDAGSVAVPSGVELTVKDSLLKLDWNISDSHRANVRYSKTEQNEPIFPGLSASSLSLSSHWYNQAKVIETLVGQLFSDWTADFSTELKVSRREYDSSPTPLNGVRLPQTTLQFQGAAPAGFVGTPTQTRSLVLGTERFRHFNVLSTKTDELYFGGNYFAGDHELKFAVDYSKNDIYNAFLADSNGQYRFQCEPGTYGSGSGAFTITNCLTATAAQHEAAVLQRFQAGLPSFYLVQAPLPGKTLNDGVGVFSATNLGLALQDTWQVAPKLSVMFGIRVDQQGVDKKPQANAALAAAPGVATSQGRATGGFGRDNTVTIDGNTLVQPRVGFNWNLSSGGVRSQLRGGAGLFQGAAANVWLSNSYSNTGLATATFSCSTAVACAAANARFSPNPDTQPTLTGTPPAANVDLLAPDFEQPSVWKFNLAFERELPELPGLGKVVASAEWLHTKTKTGLTYQHLNLGTPTRTGAVDGRELFWIPQAYNPACWNANGSAITSGVCSTPLAGGQRTRAQNNAAFGDVMLAKSTSEGGGNAVTLSLSQPNRGGLGWMVGYTRTSAKEVNPLTSSRAISNWTGRNIFNPNEEALQNSNYLVRDRVSANLNFSRAFIGKYRTTFGVFYEGRTGKPYSWTFANDMNGDGVGGNDLMYIPKAPGSNEVTFRGGAAEEARFWEVVEANPALRDAKGGVVGRNNQFAPFVNSFDLRLSQQLPGLMAGHKGTVTLDLLNFGNLINNRWGRVSEIGFPSNRSFVNYAGIDANGRYVYSLTNTEALVTRQSAGESQYAFQVTLRYEF